MKMKKPEAKDRKWQRVLKKGYILTWTARSTTSNRFVSGKVKIQYKQRKLLECPPPLYLGKDSHLWIAHKIN